MHWPRVSPARAVTRIIDGETAALDDGTELRLIGALAPRAIDAGTEPGMWPTEIAELAFGGERNDRYGRLLAQAHAREGDNRRWVQGHLLEQGWGPGHAGQLQYLRVYMTQLRHKLEKNPARPVHLLTEPGIGYRLKVS